MAGQQFAPRLQVDVEHFGDIGQLVEVADALLVQLDDRRQRRRLADDDAARCQPRADQGSQATGIAAAQVLRIQPVELLAVELGRRRGDVVEIEPLAELLHREDLVVTVRPAETGEVVEHRLRQVAGIVVLHDAHRTMSFRQLLPVVAKDHRQVGVERHRRTERLQDVDLARRVVDVVVAADDVRDAHVPVIDDDAEIVGWRTVGAGDHQVVELAVGDLDAPLDEVVPGDDSVHRIAETDNRLDPGRRLRQALARLRPPAAVVTRLATLFALLRAQAVELVGLHVAMVGGAGGEHFGDHLPITRHALCLVERALVVREPEPLHAVEDRLHGLGS